MRRLVLMLLVATTANATGLKSNGWPLSRHFPGLDSTAATAAFEFFTSSISAGSECLTTIPINRILQSEVLNNGSWTKGTNVTVTADQAVASDGTTTLDKINMGVTNVTDGASVSQASATFPSSTTQVTASAEFASVSGTATATVGVACAGSYVSTQTCVVSDGSTCTTAVSGTSVWGSATVGTTPVRMQITVTCSSSTTFYHFMAGGIPFTSKNDIIAGRAQLEAGSTMSSYIPTTAAAASATYGVHGEPISISRSSTAVCAKTDGTLVTLASSQYRMNGLGYLDEDTATNAALQSEDMNTTWGKGTGITVPATNVAGFIDATTTMDQITNAGTGAASTLSQAVALATNTNFATSVYSRSVSGTAVVSLALVTPNVSGATAYRSDGGSVSVVIGAGNAFASVVTTVGVTPVRIVLITTKSITGGNPTIVLTPGDVNAATPTNAGTAYFGGAQVESGSIATSYIATLATAVVRGADAAVSNTPTILTDAEGCMTATVYVDGITAGARALAFNGAGSLFLQTTAEARVADGTNTVVAATGVSMLSRSVVLRAGWRSSDTSLLIVNEVTPGNGTYDTTMKASTFFIGSIAGTSNHLNGYVRNVKLDTSKAGCL